MVESDKVSDKNNSESYNVVYLVKNNHLIGPNVYFSRDENAEKGFSWSDFGKAAIYRGEDGRGRAFNALRLVKQDCGYADLSVEKFQLVPIKDK